MKTTAAHKTYPNANSIASPTYSTSHNNEIWP